MSERQTSVEQLTLKPGATIGDALAVLQESSKGIALFCDESGRLCAVFTDGDLRRLLLSGSAIDAPLAAGDRAPVMAPAGTGSEQAIALMDRQLIDHLPLVDERGRVTEVILRKDIAEKIWLSSPHIGSEEMRYVDEAFATNWIAPLGPNVDAFEQEIAGLVGVGHAAAMSSGTAAIHLALRVLGVQPGETVFCSTLTFVASANPILYEHAVPVFIDSEPDSWNMSPEALERALAKAKSIGRLPRAVIVVDLYGQSAAYDLLEPICAAYGVPIIEDSAEALGATYRGKACGAFGRMGVFSFNGNKIITTSGGGMLVSDDGDLIAHARKLSTQAREPAPHYEHVEVGYNYRMSNVLAGIGRGQLSVLKDRIAARRRVFDTYVTALADVPGLSWMQEVEGSFSNRWLTTAVLDENIDAGRVFAELAKLDIEARPVWKPMHLQPLFAGAEYHQHGNQDVSANLFYRGICLPSGSNMNDGQVDRVCEALRAALERARSKAA